MEVSTHDLLTDKCVLHYFELKKITKDIDHANNQELWLKLFRAETEEDLKEIVALEVPEMTQAVQAYHHITALSEFQEKERLWAKARLDESQALNNARKLGREEGRNLERAQLIANMIKEGYDDSVIINITQLSQEEINKYKTFM